MANILFRGTIMPFSVPDLSTLTFCQEFINKIDSKEIQAFLEQHNALISKGTEEGLNEFISKNQFFLKSAAFSHQLFIELQSRSKLVSQLVAPNDTASHHSHFGKYLSYTLKNHFSRNKQSRDGEKSPQLSWYVSTVFLGLMGSLLLAPGVFFAPLLLIPIAICLVAMLLGILGIHFEYQSIKSDQKLFRSEVGAAVQRLEGINEMLEKSLNRLNRDYDNYIRPQSEALSTGADSLKTLGLFGQREGTLENTSAAESTQSDQVESNQSASSSSESAFRRSA